MNDCHNFNQYILTKSAGIHNSLANHGAYFAALSTWKKKQNLARHRGVCSGNDDATMVCLNDH